MATKRGKGQPTKFKTEYIEQAYDLAMMGMTDTELAKFFHVDQSTITEWKKVHEEFSIALTDAREKAIGKVVAAMYKNAIGYEHEDERIASDQGQPVVMKVTKRYQPNQGAAQFFLKNRDPDKWREKQEVEHSGGVEVTMVKLDEL